MSPSPRRQHKHVAEPTREPSMDDKLEAEAVDAAVAFMVPILKSFMEDKPSRQIAEMQKAHAQKLAIAAISGWINKRAEQGARKGLTALSIDKLIALRPNVDFDDPIDDVATAPDDVEGLLG